MSTSLDPNFIITTDHDFASIVLTMSPHGSRLALSGELDTATIPTVIAAALATPGDGCVTLDLSLVVFIDAAGLGGVVLMTRTCRALGRPLRIVGASERTARVFTLGGLGHLLEPDQTGAQSSDHRAVSALDATRPPTLRSTAQPMHASGSLPRS